MFSLFQVHLVKCFLKFKTKTKPVWYIPVESKRTVRQFKKVVLQKQEGKDGLGTDTCRSFAGLRDASQDNQTSTINFHIGKGPTKGFLLIFLIPWKKKAKKQPHHLICILGCCRRSRGSITSVFLPERRNSPYLQDSARTRDHPSGAGRCSRWDNSISGSAFC